MAAIKKEHEKLFKGTKFAKSKMWMALSIDSDDKMRMHASSHEEGYLLMAMFLAANEDNWEIVKDSIEKQIKIRKAVDALISGALPKKKDRR